MNVFSRVLTLGVVFFFHDATQKVVLTNSKHIEKAKGKKIRKLDKEVASLKRDLEILKAHACDLVRNIECVSRYIFCLTFVLLFRNLTS